MYSGRVVEQGTLDEIFYDPQHPYTWGLLGSITRVDRDRSTAAAGDRRAAAVAAAAAGRAVTSVRAARTASTVHGGAGAEPHDFPTTPIISTAAGSSSEAEAPPAGRRRPDRARGPETVASWHGMQHRRHQRRQPDRAPSTAQPARRRAPADPVPDQVRPDHRPDGRSRPRRRRRLVRAAARARRSGSSGSPGCGKTTLIRALVRLIDATSGAIQLPRPGHHRRASRKQLEPIRREMQMVFQDPQASLNPRKRVAPDPRDAAQLRGVPQRSDRRRDPQSARSRRAAPEHINRYPHEFSGGQRQRIGIARALAMNPAADPARRAGLGARRLDPGAGDQPARRPPGRVSICRTCSSRTT